jgi:predicted glycoside hydrolase/deacetylase ChbG (UPF0249 family)
MRPDTQRTNAVQRAAAKVGRGLSALVARPRRERTLAERLGYRRDARLLIVHADDLGIAKAANDAFFDGLASGLINSGSALVPSAQFSEVVAFARTHPDADIGLHLTLTTERTKERWAPVAGAANVPSLVDGDGFLLVDWTPETRIRPRDVEVELRAQVERALAMGLRPTHLDSHQFRLQHLGKGLFEIYLRLGREYGLPLLVTRAWFDRHPYLEALLAPKDVVLDRVHMINARIAPGEWAAFYGQILMNLSEGVSEIIIHPGYDTEEFRAFFENRLDWGAAWRQRDFDFFTSPAFRTFLEKSGVRLITWREISARLQSNATWARRATEMLGNFQRSAARERS